LTASRRPRVRFNFSVRFAHSDHALQALTPLTLRSGRLTAVKREIPAKFLQIFANAKTSFNGICYTQSEVSLQKARTKSKFNKSI